MSEELDIEEAQEIANSLDIKEGIGLESGQKDVFLAHEGDKEVVAKFLLIENQELYKRGKRELEAMEKIECDYFVDLLDFSEVQHEGLTYFVFVEEFIEGRTLREALNDGERFDEDKAKDLCKRLMTAVKEFHNHKYIHRDIKPENIMLSPERGPMLLDAGIIKFEERTNITPTHRSSAPGTYNYSAPEQLENEQILQSVRTDIFSSGIVVFESLTGENPFDIGDRAIPEVIKSGDQSRITDAIGDSISKEFCEVILKMTKKEPYNRPVGPEKVLEDLSDV
ncbi:MAG: serine/threonine-protein kinase [Candidatus Nanohaloarchaea archaeon]